MKYIFFLFFSAAVLNNFVLTKFLGICPFLGISKRRKSAISMTMAVTFVMVIASIATWLIYHFLLVKFKLEFLQIVAFILVIGTLVQLIETIMRRYTESMYEAFGIYLPLITTNCAILGVTLINIIDKHSFVDTIIYSFGAGAGFGIAIVIMSGIRERLEYANIPEPLRDVPIALITAGLLAMAFQGFAGTVSLV